MQQWGIRPVPDQEALDLSHYPEEFVEFQDEFGSPRQEREEPLSHAACVGDFP